MPRGNNVYTGLEALETETLRKPSKMSTEELRTAIKQQEAEMSKVEVHRARMQTRHWKLVHELSKRVDDETSDVEPTVEKKKETREPGNESRSPSVTINDVPMPRLKRHGDSRSPGNQGVRLTGNAITRRQSAPGRSHHNKMDKRRSRTPRYSGGSRAGSPETSSPEPSAPKAGNLDINEVTRGTGAATSSNDPTGSREKTERVPPPPSEPADSSDETAWVPQPPPPPRRTTETAQATKPEVGPCPFVDRRVKEEQGKPASSGETATAAATETVRPGVPPVPVGRVTHEKAPLDRGNRELNESTIFVSNIKYWATELEILTYFNSIGGTFEDRKPNVVVACNFAYVQGTNTFEGKAFFMYSTIALANYAVETLNNRYFKGRPLLVIISRERLNIRSNRGSSLIGSSRANERIWNCYGETQQEEDQQR